MKNSSYKDWAYKGKGLVKIAGQLYEARPRASRLAPLIFMTDPGRVPEPIKAAENLPKGSAIIYRHFGAVDKKAVSEKLRKVSFARDLQLLIGDDPVLAIEVGADGVHFRRDKNLQEPLLWRRRCPIWIISMAGLKGKQDYNGELSCLDGLLISPVFSSRSPSAGRPIGTKMLKHITGSLPAPVFALGGISTKTAPAILGTGAAGVAAVDGLR